MRLFKNEIVKKILRKIIRYKDFRILDILKNYNFSRSCGNDRIYIIFF